MSQDIVIVNQAIQDGSSDDFNIDELINKYLNDTQNLSANTKKRYAKSIRLYLEWVKASPYKLANIKLTELLIYKKYLEDKKLSGFTVSTYLVAVKLFYEWGNSMGLMFNPAAGLRSPKKDHKFMRKPLSEEQILKLFEHFRKGSKRDLAIATIMYYCGLRTIEISRLNVGDIRTEDGVREVWVQGKGKKEKDRSVKLGDKAFGPIKDYLSERESINPEDPIFLSEGVVGKPGRLVPDTISRIVKSGLVAIGLDSRLYTAHGIRHSAATNALLKGATMDQVQEMLRHADKKTTAAYTHTVREIERRKNKTAEDFL